MANETQIGSEEFDKTLEFRSNITKQITFTLF